MTSSQAFVKTEDNCITQWHLRKQNLASYGEQVIKKFSFYVSKLPAEPDPRDLEW